MLGAAFVDIGRSARHRQHAGRLFFPGGRRVRQLIANVLGEEEPCERSVRVRRWCLLLARNQGQFTVASNQVEMTSRRVRDVAQKVQGLSRSSFRVVAGCELLGIGASIRGQGSGAGAEHRRLKVAQAQGDLQSVSPGFVHQAHEFGRCSRIRRLTAPVQRQQGVAPGGFLVAGPHGDLCSHVEARDEVQSTDVVGLGPLDQTFDPRCSVFDVPGAGLR